MESEAQRSPSQCSRALELFLYFFKIGFYTFGGGWSIVAQIQQEYVQKKGWITDEDLLDITSVGFLTANSGLASRFPNQIEFPDYTGAELLAITQSIAKSKGYRLDDACAMPLVAFFDRRQSENAAENGNGRMARNTLEKAILNQSKRLVADADAALDLLLPGDFELE